MSVYLPDTAEEAGIGAGLPSWAVVAVSALVAGFADCAPTGSPGVDLLFTVALAAAATWGAAVAPWWIGTAAATVALVATAGTSTGLALIAAVALGASIALRIARFDHDWTRALVGALVAQVVLRLPSFAFLGAPALVAGVVLFGLLVAGVLHRPFRTRFIASAVLVVIGVGALFAALAAGANVFGARHDLQDGAQRVRDGLRAAESGDTATAASQLRLAAEHLDRADERLRGGLGATGRFVPVLAQHRALMLRLTDATADATRQAGDALAGIDLDTVTVNQGRVDLDAVAALERPLTELEGALAALKTALSDDDSPWLLGPVRHALADRRADVDKAAARADDALLAVRTAPTILGRDRTRTWLVGFADPERSNGNLVGYALVTADHGQVTIASLNVAAPEVWGNIDAAADLAAVGASVAATAGPGPTGAPADVVVAVDAEGVNALMQLTGPLAVPFLGRSLAAEELAGFLPAGPPTPDGRARLALVGQSAIQALVTASLPAPDQLGDVLGPAVGQDHIQAWSAVPGEQALFELIEQRSRHDGD